MKTENWRVKLEFNLGHVNLKYMTDFQVETLVGSLGIGT